MRDGNKKFEVMSRGEIEQTRASSKTPDKGPWVDWYSEMAKKTVVHRIAKLLPQSAELRTAEVLESAADAGEEQPFQFAIPATGHTLGEALPVTALPVTAPPVASLAPRSTASAPQEQSASPKGNAPNAETRGAPPRNNASQVPASASRVARDETDVLFGDQGGQGGQAAPAKQYPEGDVRHRPLGSSPASPAQLEYLITLVKRKFGEEAGAVRSRLEQEKEKFQLDTLTADQASEVIKRWNQLGNAARPMI